MWALRQGVFNEKFDNNYIRAICFCENIVVFALNTPLPKILALNQGGGVFKEHSTKTMNFDFFIP